MKIKGNLIVFSTDNEERKDVRRLKEKKLQLLLSNDNSFPVFEVKKDEYIKDSATNKMEEIFGMRRNTSASAKSKPAK